MLHSVYQWVANFVCLVLVLGRKTFVFFLLFFVEQHLEMRLMRVVNGLSARLLGIFDIMLRSFFLRLLGITHRKQQSLGFVQIIHSSLKYPHVCRIQRLSQTEEKRLVHCYTTIWVNSVSFRHFTFGEIMCLKGSLYHIKSSGCHHMHIMLLEIQWQPSSALL